MATDALVRSTPQAAAARPPVKPCMARKRFRFGEWLVDPSTNAIADASGSRQMEPRTMDVLVALCRADGAIVSVEELLEQCWGGTLHGDSPVHKNVAQLRRLLGDQAVAPRFIETIRKRGYRTIAPVDFSVDDPPAVEWEGGSPFRGLLAFDEAHAAVFHGRDAARDKLKAAVQAQIAQDLAMVLLLGPSGSGKTSLVQAGLFPALSRVNGEARPLLLASTTFDIADQGEQTLFTALAGALLDLEAGDTRPFAGENAIALGERLAQDCAGVGRRLQAALGPERGGMRFGIFVDRFEALFNDKRVNEAQRSAFIGALGELARGGACLVVLACRNDFYPGIAKYPLLMELKERGGHVDLAPPTLGEIAQMIRKPAAAARLRFGLDPATGAGLDDMLCERAADSRDVLPLLQYCLYELYRLRTPDGELSIEAFNELGDLEGAIGRRAEQLVLGLSETQRAELPHIISLVTVLSPADDLVTGARAPWSALRNEEARQVVNALIEARLFVSDLAGGTPVFGVAHEALLRRWPRMSDWIASHRDLLRVRARLAQQAQQWYAEGRHADLLIPRGRLLEEARELQNARLWTLDPLECDLIRSSDRRARQFGWIRTSALALIVLLAIANSALALNAFAAKRIAEARRSEVEGLVDFMLGDFADKLRPLGRLELLAGVSGKALEYLRSSRGDELGSAGLTLRAKALQVIGEVELARGNPQQTLEALAEAQAILLRQHEAAPRDTTVINNLGNNAYWMGQVHKDRNNLAQAERAWGDYLRFTDMLHRLEPDKPEWWIEQSYAQNNLGSLAMAGGRPALAAPRFARSIALKLRALERAPDSKMLLADLADSYSWLATARQSLGELSVAAQLYEQEVAMAAQLRRRFPDEPMWSNRYVRALQHRAELELARGNRSHALADLTDARRLLEGVAALDRGNLALQVELANLDLELHRAGAHEGTRNGSLARLTGVHATLARLAGANPGSVQWARSEAVARQRIAAAMLMQGDVAGASHHADAALARLRTLYAGAPANQEMRITLANAMLLSASVRQQGKDIGTAMMLCRQARGIMEPGIAATSDYKLLEPWFRVHVCLHENDTAEIALTRLHRIGHRDTAALQLFPTR